MTVVDQHVAEARVGYSGIQVTSATVTADEEWSPFVQVDLVGPIPDPAVLDQLDPRELVRVRVRVHRRFGAMWPLAEITDDLDGTPTLADITAWPGSDLTDISGRYMVPFAGTYPTESARPLELDLTLRRRAINRADQTMTLTLMSDEALLRDYILMDTRAVTFTANTIGDLVDQLLRRVGGVFDQTGESNAPIATAVPWQPGVSAWDYLQPFLQRANLRLWCDLDHRWRLRPHLQVVPGGAWLEFDGTVTDSDEVIDRDDDTWADGVLVTYQWTDPDTRDTIKRNEPATMPTYSKGRHVVYETSPHPYGASWRLLERAVTRNSTATIRAVADYRLRPGQYVPVTTPEGTLTGRITAITWSVPDAVMAVTLKHLNDPS